jgi:hypothetical protein
MGRPDGKADWKVNLSDARLTPGPSPSMPPPHSPSSPVAQPHGEADLIADLVHHACVVLRGVEMKGEVEGEGGGLRRVAVAEGGDGGRGGGPRRLRAHNK